MYVSYNKCVLMEMSTHKKIILPCWPVKFVCAKAKCTKNCTSIHHTPKL